MVDQLNCPLIYLFISHPASLYGQFVDDLSSYIITKKQIKEERQKRKEAKEERQTDRQTERQKEGRKQERKEGKRKEGSF